MMNFLLKIWKDPVWSKVIATGLLLILGGLYAWINQINLIPLIMSLLIYEVVIPNWLLLIAVPILISIIPLYKLLIKDSEPKFTKYKMDNILGIDWSWEWSKPNYQNNNYTIRALYSRCPNCKSSLQIENNSGQLVQCINNDCQWKWQQPGVFAERITHSSQLISKVHNIIDQKAYSGEFKT